MTITETGRPPLLDTDDAYRIEEQALAGHGKYRAATNLGVSVEALTRWLVAHDCEHWFPRPNSWRLQELAFHVDSGILLGEIAIRIGLKNEESARRILRKHDPRLLERYDRLKP